MPAQMSVRMVICTFLVTSETNEHLHLSVFEW